MAQHRAGAGHKAPLHPVDRRRRRPVPAGRAEGPRHSLGECPRRERARGRRARDGADPGAGPSPAGGAGQSEAARLATDDRRTRPARGRACGQDSADRRAWAHRRAAGPHRQGLRPPRPGYPPRRQRRQQRCGFDAHHGRASRAAVPGGHRGPHLPPHPRNDGHHRDQGAGRDEALGGPDQCRARALRRRAGADRGPGDGPDLRRRARLLHRGAAAASLAAVGVRQRADHAAHGGRNPPLRGERAEPGSMLPRARWTPDLASLVRGDEGKRIGTHLLAHRRVRKSGRIAGALAGSHRWSFSNSSHDRSNSARASSR